jgi:Tol biopolymer transport system component
VQIWVRDLASGKDRQLTNITDQPLGAAWSPDGKDRFPEHRWPLGRGRAGGGGCGQRRGHAAAALAAPTGQADMVADGRYVAVALSKAFSASFREGRNQIWVVPSDGKGKPFWRDADPIASLDTRGGGGPVWSPDGQKMAAIQDGLLKVWPVAAMPAVWGRRALQR